MTYKEEITDIYKKLKQVADIQAETIKALAGLAGEIHQIERKIDEIHKD